MPTRRDFVKLAAAAAAFTASRAAAEPRDPLPPADAGPSAPRPRTGAVERAYQCNVASRLATPVLRALAARRLKATMPVEAHDPSDRRKYTHLEALGRLLAGIAPWLELGDAAVPGDIPGEADQRAQFAALARSAIDAATDPQSPDFLNFNQGGQPLVDAGFLSQALLRAPTQLWARLPARVQTNVTAALVSSRPIRPPETNWVLFASIVEAALLHTGAPPDAARLAHGLERTQRWYLGDGMYGDGPEYHWDYYNAFVIQPMYLETLEVAAAADAKWQPAIAPARQRLARFAALQERLVAPDGTYPVIGRSVAYRCGAFQGLALAARRHLLPPHVAPAQARTALAAVIRRTLEPAGTFDEAGWLRIGVAGHQPAIAEPYISTGSLYLCAAALLPLGLPGADPFWADAPAPTTSQRLWSGENLPPDHALGGR